MMHLRWFGMLSLALVLPLPRLTAAPAPSVESPLAVVPATAPIVIHIRGFHRTLDQFEAMIANALPDQGPKLKGQIDDLLKKALQGRQLVGLAPDGPVFVVFTALPEPDEEVPAVAVLARVQDYTPFRDGLLTPDERKALRAEAGYETTLFHGAKEMYFVRHQGYAVVTPRKDVAEQFTKQRPGLKLSPDLAARLMKADVGLYVDMEALNQKYGEHIKRARDMFTEMFQQGKEGQAGLPMNNFMKQGIEAEFQVALDSRALVESLDFRPQGLALHLTAEFAAGSPTDRILQRFPRPTAQNLGKLATGSFGYGAMATTPDLVRTFGGWLHGLAGESSKTFTEAMEQLAAAGPRGWIGQYDGPARGLQVWHYDHPDQVADAQIKMYEATSLMVKDKPQVRRNAESYRGFTLHHVKITWAFDKVLAGFTPANGALPEKEKKDFLDRMKRNMGEGMQAWFGTDGKVCVMVTAADWNDARRQLDRYLDGKDTLERQEAYHQIPKHLPGEATATFLLDVSRHDQLRDLFSGPRPAPERAAKPGKVPQAPPGKPTYLGLTVQLRARRGSFDLWLPGSAVQKLCPILEFAFEEGGRMLDLP
jgi:hypothetical protein